MPSATIKVFLVHGDAKRLRTDELSNWTGKAVAGPRSELDGVLTRDEAGKSGVYFLSGTDSESGNPAVYIGEAESIRDRLRGHLDKDFWNHVLFFMPLPALVWVPPRSCGAEFTGTPVGGRDRDRRSGSRSRPCNAAGSGSRTP